MLLNKLDKDLNAQLNLYQDLYFKLSAEDPPLQKLDCLRGIMQQLTFCQQTDANLSNQAMGILMSEYGDQYIEMMDSIDDTAGVCNYSDEALSLASLKPSEIDKWKSCLKIDNFETVPSLKLYQEVSSNVKDDVEEGDFLRNLQENWKTGNERCLSLEARNMAGSDIACGTTVEASVYPPEKISNVDLQTNASFMQSKFILAHQDKSMIDLHSGASNLTGIKRKQEEQTLCMERRSKEGPGLTFRTAKEQLTLDMKTNGKKAHSSFSGSSYSSSKKSLGTRRAVSGQFVPPILNKQDEDEERNNLMANLEEMQDEKLKNIEAKMVELIKNEIMDHGPPVNWDDIAGLEFVKKTIKEIVVFPMLRPDIFMGLRGPPKGLLLFGPPGTGKTLIGKCIASNSRSTFFSISASSLTSKWVGEGEKMVRALFAVARCHQPAVIFIDEIDSLLTQRSDTEHESSRRMKTEFLVQLDGATTNAEDKLLVVGATNRPQELDEAARRRLVKRLYVPLPELNARKEIIVNLLKDQKHGLTEKHIDEIGIKAEGYSGADMANLCKEAALGPVRCLSFDDIEQISVDSVRPITSIDFEDALYQIKPSVSESDLQIYIEWNRKFGSTRG